LLIGFFSIFIILTGYKAQIILLIISLFFYYIKIAQNSKKTFFLIVNICLIIILINIFPFVVEYIKLRMASLGGAGDEVRIFEILSALNLFEQAPFWGNGLGLQFPLSGESETKNYIHNVFFYYLSTMGLFGVFLFTMVFILVFYNIKKNTIFVTSLHIVLVIFLLTTLTAASFKLIHFNYFLTILIGTLYGIVNYKRTDID
jgi:O-antigen ligase